MEYIVIYSSRDLFIYNRVSNLLRQESIEHQRLHEYRLYPENHFHALGEAQIRVLEADYIKANELLVRNKYKGKTKIVEDRYSKHFMDVFSIKPGEESEIKYEYYQKEYVPNAFSENKFAKSSKLNTDIFHTEIEALKYLNIKNVYYVLANDYKYNRGLVHSVDCGIVIEFDQEKYLSWIFVEGSYNEETNTFIPSRYELEFQNILHRVDENFRIIELTDDEHWGNIIDKKLSDFHIYSQDIGGYEIVTDLLINVEENKLAFISVKEPAKRIRKYNFSIRGEWSFVVFSEKIEETKFRRNESEQP